jgi:copper chaperone CopZ
MAAGVMRMKSGHQPIVLTTVFLLLQPGFALAKQATELTFRVKGSHCDACVAALRTALGQMKGITFQADDVRPGDAPRYASAPFVIKIADAAQTRIGAIAKVISEAKTPHRNEFPPSVSLIVYPPDVNTPNEYEAAVIALKRALEFINGVDTRKPGCVGGVPDQGFLWIQLEGTGDANLDDILAAAKTAGVRVSLKA